MQKPLVLVFAQDSGILFDIATESKLVNIRKNFSTKFGVYYSASLDRIISAQPDTPFIQVYAPGREVYDQKLLVPKTLTSIAASNSGNWLAGGAKDGSLFLWESQTGILTYTSDYHYDSVLRIAFSSDDSLMFVSAQDNKITFWALADMVSNQKSIQEQHDGVKPRFTLNEHKALILDIFCGFGTCPRLFSLSNDGALKITDVNQEECLLTLACPEKPSALAVDLAERFVLVGCETGNIHMVPLFEQIGRLDSDGVIKPLTNFSSAENIQSIEFQSQFCFNGHKDTIISLSICPDVVTMLSGDSKGIIVLWDLASCQKLKSLNISDVPITHLQFVLKDQQNLQDRKDLVNSDQVIATLQKSTSELLSRHEIPTKISCKRLDMGFLAQKSEFYDPESENVLAKTQLVYINKKLQNSKVI